MANSLAERLNGIPRRSLGMKGEAHPKKFVSPDMRAYVARLIERAIDHSGLSKKQAALAMGFPEDDQTSVSRWISGAEPPSMTRFTSVRELRRGLAIALAESDGEARIQTVVTFTNGRTA
jgi:hypothetical protein